MNVLQKRILSTLKDAGKEKSVGHIKNKLGVENSQTIYAELDILANGGYVTIIRSEDSGKIKKASITEKGINYFYEGNKPTNRQEVQTQIDELREAVELLNQAMNAPTKEEREGALSKLDKVQSVLNGAYQVYENISKFF
ncbi:hypothetical protein [Bacillus sp. JJ1474]|uniref:hypothetical protein n=1 Tax=Bacillus sp. JJ1474 TaxID=3122955 RepID=UPI002FFEE783